MTKRIKLSYGSEVSSTAISNIFIDEYMAEAHGSYVKVYIYLMRCLNDPSESVSIASFSDKLDETEKDIIKALKYWEKKKLLTISWDCEGQISSILVQPLNGDLAHAPSENIITLADSVVYTDVPEEVPATAPVSAPAAETVVTRPNYTARQLATFREMDDFNSLIDFIEDRSGCTMTRNDLQTPAFLFESLGMAPDLIRYLYDYCYFSKKEQPVGGAYIEKVAIAWNAKGVDSVEKARKETFTRSREVSAVRSAFGISRSLGAIELEFVDRWRMVYCMTPELITEACNRTLTTIGSPDFKYTDSILKRWHEAEVRCPEDIAALDEAHKSRSQQTRSSAQTRRTTNQFNQFPQRKYSAKDYADLEQRKLNATYFGDNKQQ